MKKNRFILLSLIPSVLLTSCGRVTTFKAYTDYVKDNDTYKEISGNNYVKPASFSAITYKDVNGEQRTQETFQDVYRYYDDNSTTNGLNCLESTGNQKILVVPVSFADHSFENDTKTKIIIQNAFFGNNSVNLYESVASFYNKSSYGKLKLTGEVTDVFTSSYKYEDIKGSTNTTVVDRIYNEVVDFVKENVDDLSSYYPKGNENRGLPIYMIYSAPNNVDSSSIFWAFTKNDSDIFYSWTSIDMLNTNRKNISDAHVLIHESGHLFGLQDYYPEFGKYSPTGKVDMMDYSLGDHTAYSKMLLNWTRPYHVTGSTTLEIKPFENSGDVILLNDNWNNTAMDEYLAIEYYTPKELNSFDVKYGNTDGVNEYRLMSEPGIKIYHVDSRLGYYSIRTGVSAYMGEDIPTNAYKVGIANSNHTLFRNNPLYQLLQKGGENTFINGDLADNNDLFKKGDTFGVNTFNDYSFHNGDKLGYTIKIKDITSNKAVIEITKLN